MTDALRIEILIRRRSIATEPWPRPGEQEIFGSRSLRAARSPRTGVRAPGRAAGAAPSPQRGHALLTDPQQPVAGRQPERAVVGEVQIVHVA